MKNQTLRITLAIATALSALLALPLAPASIAAPRPGAEPPAPAPTFEPVLPGYEYEFPRDHGTHDQYRTEWWYYTGHLYTDKGLRYGFELTFFRVGVSPSLAPLESLWELRQIALAHFAITDVNGKRFRFYEKLNRASPFTASFAQSHLDLFNEGWKATTLADGSWHLVARSGIDSIDLTLRLRKPPAIHGENGMSIKATGGDYASHYYSLTRLEVSGGVRGERCSGLAWMDHEFGSSRLRESQQGWDWFSVQLDNDVELMLYVIRRADGTPDVTSSGSLVSSDGAVIHLRREQLEVKSTGRWRSPRSGATYPMGWRITIPSFRLTISLRPVLEGQELITTASTQITYWEGAVDVSGSFGNTVVGGVGYVEMTGYDRAFRMKIEE